MISKRNSVIVSLIVVAVFIGTFVTTTVGQPEENETLTAIHLDMNDEVSWKDGDSYREQGSDYTTLMDEAILWNNYDYAEASWYGYLSDSVDASIYCFGARSGYTNSVQLKLYTSSSGWQTKSTQTCDYNSWNVISWTVIVTSSTTTYFRFQLVSGYLKYGPKDDWDIGINYDDGALIEIDPATSGNNYYFMGGTTFNDVDSCYDGRPDCSLHSEVSNHVVFLHDADYLQTKSFVLDSADTYSIYLSEKCLTTQCKIDVFVDGGLWKNDFTFEQGGPGCLYIGSKSLSAGSHYIKIQNEGGSSEFWWDEVMVTY